MGGRLILLQQGRYSKGRLILLQQGRYSKGHLILLNTQGHYSKGLLAPGHRKGCHCRAKLTCEEILVVSRNRGQPKQIGGYGRRISKPVEVEVSLMLRGVESQSINQYLLGYLKLSQ